MDNDSKRLEVLAFERVSAPNCGRLPREMHIHRCPKTLIGRSLRCDFSDAALDYVSAEVVIDRIVSSFFGMEMQDKEGLERLIHVLNRGLQNAEDFLDQIERDEVQAARARVARKEEAISRIRLATFDDDTSDAEILGAAEALVAALKEA